MWENGKLISTSDLASYIKKQILKANSIANSDIRITNCWNWFTNYKIKPDLNYSETDACSYLPSRQAKQTFYSSEVVFKKNIKIRVFEEFEQDLIEIKNRG